MIPRLRFAHLPTPIEAMPRLASALGSKVKLYIKRDDQTGLAMGGNKTRKLEFLVAEAQANGARMLISAGARQSNHCRQVAAAAAHFGLSCTLVLSGEPSMESSGNLFLDQILGAGIVWTTLENRQATLQDEFNRAWAEGKRPYLIPYGGSNATGALAYAFAFEEALLQDIQPDWIVFASSSGGTQAGLVLGAQRQDWKGHILGISVDEEKSVLQTRVAKLASEASERLGPRIEIAPETIEVNDRYLGQGYGMMGNLEKEAIQLFAQNEGILLDPVYTGRAAGGMIDLIRQDFFRPGDTILFWHTGGTPALFAAPYTSAILEE